MQSRWRVLTLFKPFTTNEHPAVCVGGWLHGKRRSNAHNETLLDVKRTCNGQDHRRSTIKRVAVSINDAAVAHLWNKTPHKLGEPSQGVSRGTPSSYCCQMSSTAFILIKGRLRAVMITDVISRFCHPSLSFTINLQLRLTDRLHEKPSYFDDISQLLALHFSFQFAYNNTPTHLPPSFFCSSVLPSAVFYEF